MQEAANKFCHSLFVDIVVLTMTIYTPTTWCKCHSEFRMSWTMSSLVALSVLALSITLSEGGEMNISAILVFGDSTVDPGNNNGLPNAPKADFPPYGMDFFGGRATGRFCDGRIATDFISELLGISKSIPAFLDPHLQPEQLRSGVSFASASSGYDVLTATNADVISFPKQIEYLEHYVIHLRKLVGPIKAMQIVKNAVVVFSAGTNDIMVTYNLYPDRAKQFTMAQYTGYLVSLLSNYTKEIHRFGITKFAVVGVPPIGCLPLIKFVAGSDTCVTEFNNASDLFNKKLVAELAVLEKTLGVRTAYIDCYHSFVEALRDAVKFGFVETSKGCCGTGTTEYGDTCKGLTTCKDPSSYMFFDAVHPTQRMYRLIAEKAMLVSVKELIG